MCSKEFHAAFWKFLRCTIFVNATSSKVCSTAQVSDRFSLHVHEIRLLLTLIRIIALSPQNSGGIKLMCSKSDMLKFAGPNEPIFIPFGVRYPDNTTAKKHI